MDSSDMGMLLIFDVQETRNKAFDLLSELYERKYVGHKHIEKRQAWAPDGSIVVAGERRWYQGKFFIILNDPSPADFWHSEEYAIMTKNNCTHSADPLVEYGEILQFSDAD